jgi:hypothetical protein
MSMKKTDYELVATGISKALRTWTPDTLERKTAIYALKDLAVTLADELQQDNKKFNRSKFLAACSIEQEQE